MCYIDDQLAKAFLNAEGSTCSFFAKATGLQSSAATLLVESLNGWKNPSLALNNIKDLSDEAGRGLTGFNGHLSLNGLKQISVQVAKALATCSGSVYLGGLEELSAEAADQLSSFYGRTLVLGLKELSPEAANGLGGIKREQCHLYLDKLTHLLPGTARNLAKFQGSSLSLDGLKEFSDEVATGLSSLAGPEIFGCNLHLNGVEHISNDAAQAFEKFIGFSLQMNRLTCISASSARSISQAQVSVISLRGLKMLPQEVATEFAQFEGFLFFDGVESISASTLKLIESFQCLRLSLNGIVGLSDDDARSLSKLNSCDLCIDGVTELSDSAASSLSEFRGELSLRGLSELSEVAAEALARREAKMKLRSPRLSNATAKILAARARLQKEHYRPMNGTLNGLGSGYGTWWPGH